VSNQELEKVFAFLKSLTQATDATPSGLAAEGERLFTEKGCAACHGARAQGAIGPALAAPSLRDTELDEATLVKTISRGRPDKGMPAWSEEDDGPLKKHQIRDLAVFIKSWDDNVLEEARKDIEAELAELATPTPEVTPSPTPKATPTSRAAPTPTPGFTATPDLAAEGEGLFTGKGCAACHGAEAQGGIGPSLVGVSRETVLKTVREGRPGTPMAAFSTEQVSDADLDRIIAFLESLK
jgi:mono/diheme cytochrome c family protein